jgi:hypothetical protein
MTLQEKIDKLPLNIEYNGVSFELRINISHWGVILRYIDLRSYSDLFVVEEHKENRSISKLFEDVIDRALTIIENKEWEI